MTPSHLPPADPSGRRFDARGDRSVHAVATVVRERALADLHGLPPTSEVFHRIAEEIHASCPQASRFKCFRLAHGWTVEEAIENFHLMCDREGVKRRGLTERSWREWEAGSRPDRDYTDLLCRLFETGPVQLGFARDYTPEHMRAYSAPPPDPIAMAADEASAHAERAEASELGSSAIERLRAEVVWIGRRYVWEAPLPLFVEMRGLQDRTRKALDKRIHPGQASELYFLTGALCGLMANVSMDLGRRVPADTLARAAWTYGRIAGHAPLMGWARGMQSQVALWDKRYHDALGYSEEGLNVLSRGAGGARLYMLKARACAMLSRRAEALEALARAEEARAAGEGDELHDEMAGEFAFLPAKQHYYASVTRLHLGDSRSAIEEGWSSLRLYADDDAHNRSYGCEAMARAHLVIAHLMEDDAEGADRAVAPLLSLPPERRISSLALTLGAGRALLAAHPDGERTARQIESFCAVGLPQAVPAISDGGTR
ncbi:hypothetical protein HNP84_004769 [Thermocatellispora tengchongensis]|uniref:XRE family transcriptional regulator n=1 Tax=Thermocatellispora tengchongensis TaxID=1073253 RepID=A0A840PAS5_9ACTN|nr:hypothetical protein [Thermocatellispora tengchongensis]MBB5135033.1 hypothetical protein [Thermocatellispora tengchongensis]